MALYGRGFKSVDLGHWDGLLITDGSARHRTAQGTCDGGQWGNLGVCAYWDPLLQHGGDAGTPQNNVTQASPPATECPYGAYLLEGDLFVGFGSRGSIADKMQYIVEQGLGSVTF